MGLDVIRMAVATEVVVGHHDLRAHLADHRDQFARGNQQVRAPEALGAIVRGRAHHARVAEPTGPAQQPPVRHAQLGHRVGQLGLAMLAERVLLVGSQVRELGKEDLALLAERAGDEGDLGALRHVLRHRRTGADALVVGVGMDQQQASRHRERVPMPTMPR